MKKKILWTLALVLCVAGAVFLWRYMNDWTLRYRQDLDDFFGQGNWSCVDEEREESLLAFSHVRSASRINDTQVAKKYTNWYIAFQNYAGEEELWRITNHALIINHDRYGLFQWNNRLSARQALTLELMEISFDMVGEQVVEEIILALLSQEEAACFDVAIAYEGGNPKPGFYDQLRKEEWFHANRVTAGDYLACEDQDFYLRIHVHDYRLAKLTDQQRENVLNSLQPMIQKLLEKYGHNASFQIYLDSEHRACYQDGVDVTDD